VLCVRWYLRYALSYRDLEEMMLERGLYVDHTTIYRWGEPLCSGDRQTLSASPQSL
jgi:transposase-like protein